MKVKNIICYTVMLLLMTSCSAGQETIPKSKKNSKSAESSDSGDNDVQYNIDNQVYHIYDINDNVIGQIECNGRISLIDDKLFYSIPSDDSTDKKLINDYYLYDIKTKDNVKLGSLEDIVYEASYDRVLIGDHIYTAVTTGDYYDSDSWEYNLLDFDIKTKSMDIILSEKDDYPYSTMDSIEDDLLLIRSNTDSMKVDRFDTEKCEYITLKKFNSNKDSVVNESLRSVYYEDGNIFLLRVNAADDGHSSLFFDKYDKNMNLISSTDISDVFDIYEDETNQTERCQPVEDFFCKNGIMYYANRSVSRFILNIGNDSIIPVMKDEGEDTSFEVSRMISKSDSPRLFYRSLDPDRSVYILNTDTGELTETTFSVKDTNFYTEGIFQSNDKLLVAMTNFDFDAPGGGDYEDRLYYLTIDDIINI